MLKSEVIRKFNKSENDYKKYYNEIQYFLPFLILAKSPLLYKYLNDSPNNDSFRKDIINFKSALANVDPVVYTFCKYMVNHLDEIFIERDYEYRFGDDDECNEFTVWHQVYVERRAGFKFDTDLNIQFYTNDGWIKFTTDTNLKYNFIVLYSIYHGVEQMKKIEKELENIRNIANERERYMLTYGESNDSR